MCVLVLLISHSVRINKVNFFLVCREKTWKIIFKNQNSYWLKFWKIRTSWFAEVLKVKNQDCPDKIRTVGKYASEPQLAREIQIENENFSCSFVVFTFSSLVYWAVSKYSFAMVTHFLTRAIIALSSDVASEVYVRSASKWRMELERAQISDERFTSTCVLISKQQRIEDTDFEVRPPLLNFLISKLISWTEF